MASSSLTPYLDNTSSGTFNLVSSSIELTRWIASGRSISAPWAIERSLKKSSGKSNDHVIVRVFKTDLNSTTGQLVTGQVLLDISIPKDNTTITNTEMVELLGVLTSVLNQYSANNASSAVRTALVEGRDL